MLQVAAYVRRYALAVPAVLVACSANQPIALAPGPAGMAEYFATHHPTDLLVTDSTGRSRWIHNATLDGDTLRGLRDRDLPRQRVAIPVMQVRSVAAPQFSAGRTLGLLGGVLGAVTVGILVLALHGPRPVY